VVVIPYLPAIKNSAMPWQDVFHLGRGLFEALDELENQRQLENPYHHGAADHLRKTGARTRSPH